MRRDGTDEKDRGWRVATKSFFMFLLLLDPPCHPGFKKHKNPPSSLTAISPKKIPFFRGGIKKPRRRSIVVDIMNFFQGKARVAAEEIEGEISLLPTLSEGGCGD